MKAKEAMEVLGLERAMTDLTPGAVTEAFRQRVKLAHPDTAVTPGESKHSVQQLTMAKKVLLESLSGAYLSCRLCQGRGKVRARMGFVDCVACNGTGERK